MGYFEIGGWLIRNTEGVMVGGVVGLMEGLNDGDKLAGRTDGCWVGLLDAVATKVTQKKVFGVQDQGPPPFSNPLVVSQLQPKPWLLGEPWLLPDFQLSQVAPDLVVQSLFIPDAWFIQVDVIALVKGNVMKPNESVWPI